MAEPNGRRLVPSADSNDTTPNDEVVRSGQAFVGQGPTPGVVDTAGHHGLSAMNTVDLALGHRRPEDEQPDSEDRGDGKDNGIQGNAHPEPTPEGAHGPLPSRPMIWLIR